MSAPVASPRLFAALLLALGLLFEVLIPPPAMAGPLESIRLSPSSAVLVAGASVQFTAFGLDGLGNPVPLNATWEADGGILTRVGVFSSTRAGNWTVYANDSGVSGRAWVVVHPAPLASMTLTPSAVEVAQRSEVTFVLQGEDAFGNPVTPSGTRWAWQGEATSVDQNDTSLHLWVSGNPGPVRVTATAGALETSSEVTVTGVSGLSILIGLFVLLGVIIGLLVFLARIGWKGAPRPTPQEWAGQPEDPVPVDTPEDGELGRP